MTTPGWPTPRSARRERADLRGVLGPRLAYFAGYGITAPERLIPTRLGLPLLTARGLRKARDFGRSSSSRTALQNGKAERYNRTLASEWAYRQVWLTNDQRAAALGP